VKRRIVGSSRALPDDQLNNKKDEAAYTEHDILVSSMGRSNKDQDVIGSVAVTNSTLLAPNITPNDIDTNEFTPFGHHSGSSGSGRMSDPNDPQQKSAIPDLTGQVTQIDPFAVFTGGYSDIFRGAYGTSPVSIFHTVLP
jgi:hypothetical protein